MQVLSLSYIAASIFYIINTHYPEHVRKEKVKGIIKVHIKDFYDVCNALQYAFFLHSAIRQVATKDKEVDKQSKNTVEQLPIKLKKTNEAIKINNETFNNWKDALVYSSSALDQQMNNLMQFKNEMNINTILTLSYIRSSVSFLQRQLTQVVDNENLTFSIINCEVYVTQFTKSLNELVEDIPELKANEQYN